MEKRGQEIMSPVDQSENNSENTLCKVTKTMIGDLNILILLNWEVRVLN